MRCERSRTVGSHPREIICKPERNCARYLLEHRPDARRPRSHEAGIPGIGRRRGVRRRTVEPMSSLPRVHRTQRRDVHAGRCQLLLRIAPRCSRRRAQGRFRARQGYSEPAARAPPSNRRWSRCLAPLLVLSRRPGLDNGREYDRELVRCLIRGFEQPTWAVTARDDAAAHLLERVRVDHTFSAVCRRPPAVPRTAQRRDHRQPPPHCN